MTSPAQLKYLDAIGIPVWVSRDLIIEVDKSIEIAPKSTANQSAFAQSSNDFSKQPSTNENNSALGILNSLDESSEKPVNSPVHAPKQNQSENRKPILDRVVEDSINKTKLVEETSSPSSLSAGTAVTLDDTNLLFKSSHQHVYASGSDNAEWMVIGHSPEPFNGIGQEPFASEPGELLNNMLRAVGINQPRSQAYLLNVIDVNKSLETDVEIQQKLKLELLAVIKKIKPKIVLLVGQIAAQNLLSLNDPLIIMRSKVHKISDSDIPCVVTYYPSYLLQKTSDKRKAWNDLKLAMSQIS